MFSTYPDFPDTFDRKFHLSKHWGEKCAIEANRCVWGLDVKHVKYGVTYNSDDMSKVMRNVVKHEDASWAWVLWQTTRREMRGNISICCKHERQVWNIGMMKRYAGCSNTGGVARLEGGGGTCYLLHPPPAKRYSGVYMDTASRKPDPKVGATVNCLQSARPGGCLSPCFCREKRPPMWVCVGMCASVVVCDCTFRLCVTV